ncbi:N-terminal amidase [Apiospora hydei]|uniref:N-terminal amidase n=1 Tax=Apiospora hydei TaxID=1337664 RepID=A0ABR1UWB7_9PEZI
MRIACLQFAPQVGDIDNNLNRADAVLSKANPEDLDLLVLPELAFTGYNFKSLQHITPYLEPKGSGISALWARTTALKHNCVVTVGYPEKVDVKPKWPTSPEYYNSCIIINGEGETVGNYRKNFLYYTDESWALEGQEGFYEGYIPGLGHTSMGICMDINPYKFEAPWHAFEFAFHVLEMESNLVIMTMAWLTREDGRMFSRMPKEPDMDTLTYWITRLEPLIRDENDEEIIIVFCNRTGIEDDAVYAGTSAVIGIKDGEVRVYGMLGRGDKELLVVDTDVEPFAKLVYRPEDGSAVASVNGDSKRPTRTTTPQPGFPEAGQEPIPEPRQEHRQEHRSESRQESRREHRQEYSSGKSTKSHSSGSSESGRTEKTSSSKRSTSSKRTESRIGRTHRTDPGADHQDVPSNSVREYEHVPVGSRSRAGSVRSTLSAHGSVSSKGSKQSKHSQESQRSKSSSRTRDSKGSSDSKDRKHSSSTRPSSRKQERPLPKIQIPPPPLPGNNNAIPTPTGPSPTPQALRPKLIIPSDAHKRPAVPHVPTPHPSAGAYKSRDTRIYGGHVSIQQHHNDIMTPTTAFEDASPMSPRFFWIPSDSMLKTPLDSRMWTPALADSPILKNYTPVVSRSAVQSRSAMHRREPSTTSQHPAERPATGPPEKSGSKPDDSQMQKGDENSRSENDARPDRPASPKSRNASRTRQLDRSDSAMGNHADLAAIAQRLEALSPRPDSAASQRINAPSPRPGSSMGHHVTGEGAQEAFPERPSAPKSRNASRTRVVSPVDPVGKERQSSVSRASIPIAASPGIEMQQLHRGPTALTYRPDVRMTNIEAAFRSASRPTHSRSNSISTADLRAITGNSTGVVRPQSRAASRGRQRAPKEPLYTNQDGAAEAQSSPRDTSIPARRPSAPSYGFRSPAEYEEVRRISPEYQNSGGVEDENEIVQEIVIRSCPNCPTHGHMHRNTPQLQQEQQHIATQYAPATGETGKSPEPTAPADASFNKEYKESMSILSHYSSSVETLASTKTSPATPAFDPKAPKAMVFVRNDDDTIPTTPLSAPFLNQALKSPKALERELMGKGIDRPKSAVW